MDVSLRPVTRENLRAVLDLKLAPGQEHFVASNAVSLAQAYVERDWTPLAIYAGELVVGFAMHGLEAERQREWIIRLMVGAEHQGRGYGRAAMRLLIERLRAKPGCDAIYISYEPENAVAERLYASLGFAPTGEIEGGEVVARLDLV